MGDQYQKIPYLYQLVRYLFATVSVITLLAISAYFAEMFLFSDPSPKLFDSQTWRQIQAYDNSTDRKAMLDDLLQKHQLLGMTKAQVDVLLGDGDQTGHWQDWDRNYWLYDLIPIDSQWLVMRFDEQDRVNEFDIVSD